MVVRPVDFGSHNFGNLGTALPGRISVSYLMARITRARPSGYAGLVLDVADGLELKWGVLSAGS
jgi:hypothetical protein